MRRRLRFGQLLFVLGLAMGGLTLLGGSALHSLYRAEFPDAAVLKKQFPVVVYQGPKQPPKIRWSKGRPAHWVSLGGISRVARGAVIVSEDWAFYSHAGYDANQIKEAIKEDLEKGSFARGASTITQQVAKNVFLESRKSLWRKVRELVLAFALERDVGKNRILETYFNVAEWGEGIFGIRAAAQHYFGKDPSQLTPREGAFLALLLPSPKRYSVSFRRKSLTPYARSTLESILSKMVQARFIDESEQFQALSGRMGFEASDAQAAENTKKDGVLDENSSEPSE